MLINICRGTSVYSTVTEHLHRLKRDAQNEAQAALISEYISQIQVIQCFSHALHTVMYFRPNPVQG